MAHSRRTWAPGTLLANEAVPATRGGAYPGLDRAPVLLALCGFSGALATRLLDPLITSIASEFATSISVAALLSSAFALPFGLSQPLLGPAGDAYGKAAVQGRDGSSSFLSRRICPGPESDCPVHQPHSRWCSGGRHHADLAGADRRPMSRFVAATLIGQLVGVSLGAIIAEWIGWRGVLGCAAAVAVLAAAAAMLLLPKADQARSDFRFDQARGRYGLVIRNRRSLICFGTVFVSGLPSTG
jgi:MFS family permease